MNGNFITITVGEAIQKDGGEQDQSYSHRKHDPLVAKIMKRSKWSTKY